MSTQVAYTRLNATVNNKQMRIKAF